MELVETFLTEAKEQHRYTPATLRTYSPALHAYCKWVEADTRLPSTLHDLNKAILKEYLASLKRRNLRPRTILGYFSALAAFCDWLVKNDHLAENPIYAIELPRKDTAVRALVTQEEVEALLLACRALYPPRRQRLATALFSVLCCCGPRRSELLSMRVQDVHLDKSATIEIPNGKGRKFRRIFLPTEAAHAVQNWLRERATMHCQHDFLWALDIRRRVAEEALSALFASVKSAAGLSDHANILPHSLRHAAASNMERSGMPITDIQAQLGHSNVAQTAIYLHTDDTRRSETAQKAGWLEKPPPSRPNPPPSPPGARRRNEQHRRFLIQRNE